MTRKSVAEPVNPGLTIGAALNRIRVAGLPSESLSGSIAATSDHKKFWWLERQYFQKICRPFDDLQAEVVGAWFPVCRKLRFLFKRTQKRIAECAEVADTVSDLVEIRWVLNCSRVKYLLPARLVVLVAHRPPRTLISTRPRSGRFGSLAT